MERLDAVIGSALALAVAVVAYLTYFVVGRSQVLERWAAARVADGQTPTVWLVPAQRLLGFVLLGVVPMGIAFAALGKSPSDYGFNSQNVPRALAWTAALLAIAIPIALLGIRKPEHLEVYPLIRARRWTPRLLWLEAITWIPYLIGYEFLFRGLVLQEAVSLFGYWAGVSVAVAAYALAHIPVGTRAEAASSIPFGVVLAIGTLSLGNLWFALLAHYVMALVNCRASVHFHPEMTYSRTPRDV